VRSVVVVGGGVGGTAAALAAARAGASVALVDGGTGATTLSTGAIDDVPWTAASRPPASLGPGVQELVEALVGYAVPDAGARIATTAGMVRPARGHDLALLDLGPLAGRPVGVVLCDRPGWDATALARAWGSDFTPLQATLLRHADERWLPAADFAARHDDEARLAWLAERLREALRGGGSRIDALLVPPSLGVERERARSLSARVGLPCGEAAALPGGPSGLRFEHARDRALVAARVERTAGRATSVVRDGARWRVGLAEGPALEAAAVVLAAGGLLGGGLAYTPGDAAEASVLPPASRAPFQITLDVPAATLGARGRPLEIPGSLFGIAPESLAWPFAREPLMDRVGILVDTEGRAGPGLYAAGDVVADAPRTWLRALESGLRAGLAAAREGLTSTTERSPAACAAPAIRP
jgi:glycerol-3-phosphate dehydrogenase subunit B